MEKFLKSYRDFCINIKIEQDEIKHRYKRCKFFGERGDAINNIEKVIKGVDDIREFDLNGIDKQSDDFSRLIVMKKLFDLYNISVDVGQLLSKLYLDKDAIVSVYNKEIDEVRKNISLEKKLIKNLKKTYKLSCKEYKKKNYVIGDKVYNNCMSITNIEVIFKKYSKYGFYKYMMLYKENEFEKKYDNKFRLRDKIEFYNYFLNRYWRKITEPLYLCLESLDNYFEINGFLPKDLQKIEIINILISYMKTGKATNIKQAITIYYVNYCN